jgi:L-fuconolactonase
MDKPETAQNSRDDMERRTFIAGAAAATATFAASGSALAQTASVDNIPIIDAHIHLFDNTTPLGAGYMGSAAYKALNKPSLPSMYAPLAKPTGIVGAIVVESSAFYDDNLVRPLCDTLPKGPALPRHPGQPFL